MHALITNHALIFIFFKKILNIETHSCLLAACFVSGIVLLCPECLVPCYCEAMGETEMQKESKHLVCFDMSLFSFSGSELWQAFG